MKVIRKNIHFVVWFLLRSILVDCVAVNTCQMFNGLFQFHLIMQKNLIILTSHYLVADTKICQVLQLCSMK